MGENETADISTASSSTPPAAPKMRTPLNRNSSVRSVRRLSLGDEISIISDGGRGSVLDDEAREVRGLARKETFKVNLLRVMVAICILSAASIISIYTYRILRDEEKEDSQASFKLVSSSIEKIVQEQFKDLADATRACSRLIMSEATKNNWDFPFVTMTSFELYAQQARERARIESLMYLPVVPNGDLEQFNDYMRSNEGWVEESRKLLYTTLNPNAEVDNEYVEFMDSMFNLVNNKVVVTEEGSGPYIPLWQWSPPPKGGPNSIGKENFASLVDELKLMTASGESEDFVLGQMNTRYQELAITLLGESRHNLMHPGMQSGQATPHALFSQPIQGTVDGASGVVGYLLGVVALDTYLTDLIPPGVKGLAMVVENTCGDQHTFRLEQGRAIYVGEGDMSIPKYRNAAAKFNVQGARGFNGDSSDSFCSYSFSILKTHEFEDSYASDKTILYTVLVVIIFAVTAFAFFIYDFIVQRRNSLVLQTAAKFNTIVSSLFPSNIRGRLFADKEKGYMEYTTAKSHLKNFLTKGDINMNEEDDDDDGLILKTKPMADLFTDTTIMFADIAGFTAWSSVREPSQVFILLETVYRSFDQIAKKRRVFKVETVGDCYVAVAGLPDPREDHAIVMARFARECLLQMNILVKKLEVNLGPDTGDLGLRIGLHSGAVTAGVLRGERSRFQLFGDTMNTTARMESTGIRDRIQISEETADLLHQAGKNHWFEPREDTVVAKGKGALKTFWLRTSDNLEKRKRPSLPDEMRSSMIEKEAVDKLATEKTARLIDWNCDVLLRLLKQIVARRRAMAKYKQSNIVGLNSLKSSRRASLSGSIHGNAMDESNENGTVIDEVMEIITLPKLDLKLAKAQEDADAVELDNAVVNQLTEYVSNIAAMYRDNPFHNFEHASHVTMSVVKLLSRIVAPSDLSDEEVDKKKKGNRVSISFLHDHTYGITSDPLTQFACVLSALIHDADHPGVPNAQLIKEKTRIAMYYKNQSIAEQNSVDLCWDLLMDPRFRTLRETIYSNDAERRRFRQLVVNSVMATDIVDKELKALRNARWERAFRETPGDDAEDYETNINRKATIVIEHLIQASDVAHTMQHWHIYRKWNERFFMECYKGFQDGRAEKDPSENWYNGELGFFDFYIIPLAKKLKDCGVFGVSSDEYLQYAQKNRQEWEIRGREIVAGMIEKVQKSSGLQGMTGASQRKLSFDSSDEDVPGES